MMQSQGTLFFGGNRIGQVVVPSFRARVGDFVAVICPIDFGVRWLEIMHELTGMPRLSGTLIDSTACVVAPQFEQAALKSSSLAEVFGADNERPFSNVFCDLGLSGDTIYGALQLTQQLRFRVRLEFLRGAKLILFTTAGLDPRGIAAVHSEVRAHLGQWCAVEVVHASLLPFYQGIERYTSIVNMSINIFGK